MAEQETSPRSPHSRSGREEALNVSRVTCRSTYELIREAAARNPEHTAIALPRGGEQLDRPGHLSYGALLGGIHQTAHLLADLGIELGDVIALLLPDLLEAHLLFWGGQAAGIVCLLPSRLPVEGTIVLLRAAQAKLLVIAGGEGSQAQWQQMQKVRREVKSIGAILQVRGPGREQDAVYAFDTLLGAYPNSSLPTRQQIASDDIAISLLIKDTIDSPGFISLTQAGSGVSEKDMVDCEGQFQMK